MLPDNDFKGLKWDSVLTKVTDLIKGFISMDSYKGTFLANAIAITTGFDDGDLIRIK